MKDYEVKTFDLPEISGISAKQIEIHLGLYAGYVKHVNLLRAQVHALKKEGVPTYVTDELRRRYAFEFNGMRMHEYYFEQLVGGPNSLPEDTLLAKLATTKYGSIDAFFAHIKEVAGSRGIGWVVVTHDTRANVLHTTWVSDHELGQLGGSPIVFVLDMWEHAFMVDYVPGEKGTYVDTYLAHTNWGTVAKRVIE